MTVGGQIVNPYNFRSDCGNSKDDVPQRFVGNLRVENAIL